jgi:hypothetical protein
MKRFATFLVFSLFLVPLVGVAQNLIESGDEYTLEAPPNWRENSQGEGVRKQVELVNGDRASGYLRIRKEVVEAGTSASAVARSDQEKRLQFIPGFVAGKEEPFAGRLSGSTISYEFINGGKPMAGRIYYLQADARTFYILHFTGARDNLLRIRNQTDAIARSFKLK